MKDSAHVVVVGAGVVGCSVAYELARRGRRVVVVERRDVGQGATQASAGVLSPYISAHASGAMLELGARSLRLYDEFVARVVEDSGSTIQYVRSGTVEIALDDRSADTLRATAGAVGRAGVDARFLDHAEVREVEPQLAPGVVAGLLVEEHGYVGATDLTAALRRAAGAYGVTFRSAASVTRVTRRADALCVEMSPDEMSCEAVVIAAGSWSGQVEVEGDDPVPVRPVRGQLLHLDWPSTPPERVIWTDRCYLVPWADGSVLIGATMEEVGFDERPTVAGIQELLDMTCQLVPRAQKAWFRGVRVGLRPATPDNLPFVGSGQVPGVYYATGHFRNGVLLAPLTASLIADAVVEGKRDDALGSLDPARFAA